ncbi:MAG: NTP transferase domain-containing protein [Verrucomicrobia bacterium]|nr:NTP transferase domain-containing protein [Verrucomicrobiota bacterium]
MDMKRPFVTIVLAGGKGTRMGSSDRHKVCFEVLGVPVIIRALETYNLCGAMMNIVVVGMMADKVMATVHPRVPGTVFAFQDQPRGTGDAARQGAAILERLRFEGDVLVVAGDKVIEPGVIRRMLTAHHRAEADVTLATAVRPLHSSTGILLKSRRGHIVGILEESDRQRLIALAGIHQAFQHQTPLPHEVVRTLVSRHCGDKTAATLLQDLWAGTAAGQPLARDAFEQRFSPDARHGLVRAGTRAVRADQVLARFDQMNLSTYLFRAPVLYDALHRLHAARSGKEEYLTDVFALLARRPHPARVVGCEVGDVRDLMAYNNPQELLAIEEVYRARQGVPAAATPAVAPHHLAPVQAWENLLNAPSPAARRQFRQWYGEEVPWAAIRRVVQAFGDRYGTGSPVAIMRSPGRINVLGRHIDHQGGTVNVMAINREIILVAAPRTDDRVSLANTDPTQFASQEFRISDLVARLDWDDWQHVVDGPRIQRLLEAARGDWGNYVMAACLRLQDLFRDRRLRGLDMLVGGDIPMGAGLSSSSALVVATAEAITAFNRLPVSSRRLVSLCGEGEWFVGTRGGAADHAAIKLSRRGYVTRVDFFPFRIEDTARFFPGHDLVVCNSGVYAGKSHQARNTFNQKVTAYHIGRVWFKMLRPDLAPRIEHLRDLTPNHLGLRHPEWLRLLAQLPVRITRARVQAAFGHMIEPERDRLARLFLSHDAPPDGYPVRDVVLFGLAEMARARRCLTLLKRKNAAELGRLMRLSHDGDRVSRADPQGRWRRCPMSVPDRALRALARRPGSDRDLATLSGAYGCSLPEIDRIVDLVQPLPGVEGAQLAGAGLGGCVMVLAQKAHTADILRALDGHGIQAEVFRPIAGACSLVMD